MLTTNNAGGLVLHQLTQEMKMKRIQIKITRDTVVNGVAVVVGQTVIAPEADARLLISLNKATAMEEEPESAPVETADAAPVEMESTDVKRPARKARPKE